MMFRKAIHRALRQRPLFGGGLAQIFVGIVFMIADPFDKSIATGATCIAIGIMFMGFGLDMVYTDERYEKRREESERKHEARMREIDERYGHDGEIQEKTRSN